MVPLRSDVWSQTPSRKAEDCPISMAFLDHLRVVSLNCRSKPRTDLFKACAALHGDRDVSKDVYAEALMRCLSEALGKPARLHAPGVVELSFDEAWLVQLNAACRSRDDASLTFLLNSRVDQKHRRIVGFLIHQISVNSI